MLNIITIEQIEGENGRALFVHIIFSMQTKMDTIIYVTSEISGILIRYIPVVTCVLRTVHLSVTLGNTGLGCDFAGF